MAGRHRRAASLLHALQRNAPLCARARTLPSVEIHLLGDLLLARARHRQVRGHPPRVRRDPRARLPAPQYACARPRVSARARSHNVHNLQIRSYKTFTRIQPSQRAHILTFCDTIGHIGRFGSGALPAETPLPPIPSRRKQSSPCNRERRTRMKHLVNNQLKAPAIIHEGGCRDSIGRRRTR